MSRRLFPPSSFKGGLPYFPTGASPLSTFLFIMQFLPHNRFPRLSYNPAAGSTNLRETTREIPWLNESIPFFCFPPPTVFISGRSTGRNPPLSPLIRLSPNDSSPLFYGGAGESPLPPPFFDLPFLSLSFDPKSPFSRPCPPSTQCLLAL